MRALLWLGSYCVLVLLPLLLSAANDPFSEPRPFALELAAATGLIAFALIAIEFALVTRLHTVSASFGTDALWLFHRLMGLAALGFSLAHPALHALSARDWHPTTPTLVAQSGTISLVSLVALVLTSVLRRSLHISYPFWQIAHRALALAAIGAMLVHALAARGYVRAPLVRGALALYVAGFVALMLHYRLVRPWLRTRRPWLVVENRDQGGDTRTLVLSPVGHTGIDFEPGQFVWLSTGANPLFAEEHPITIASSAQPSQGRTVELAIKALGDWSREVVPRLAPGETVQLDGPFGAFSLDRGPAERLVLIAGGIGVTPMRSMLLSMRDRGDRRPVVLFFAARNRARAVFADELARLAGAINFELVLVLEEGDADPACERGLITPQLLRRHFGPDVARTRFFVCGPPAMMDAVAEILDGLGVPAQNVETERFDLV